MEKIKTAEEVLHSFSSLTDRRKSKIIEAMQAHTGAALEALRRDIINKYNTGATDFDIAGIDLEQFIK